MPSSDLFDIDELVRNGQMTAAAEDNRKRHLVGLEKPDNSGRLNGHDSFRSPNSRSPERLVSDTMIKASSGSPRHSTYASSLESPRQERKLGYGRRTEADRIRHDLQDQERDRLDQERRDMRSKTKAEDRDHTRTSRRDRDGRRPSSRSRSKSRSRSRSPRSRRPSYRERSTSRDRDRYRHDRRERSRSYDRRDRDRDRDYYARDDRDYDDRRGYNRPPPRDYRRRPQPARDADPAEDGSDLRSVFVQQLAMRVQDAHLRKFFAEAGVVQVATVMKDRNGRSKGLGYVQFKDIESVEKAIGLTGRKLMDVPLIVAASLADKNRQARKPEGMATQTNGVPFHRLYVGNIHFSITEEDLKDVFAVYGELSAVVLTKDETGRSKGYAFVQFIEADDAKTALSKLNGFELAGRPMRVGLGREDKADAAEKMAQTAANGQPHGYQGSDFSGAGGRTANARTNTDRNADKASGVGGSGALDDSEAGGVNYSNYSRHALMKRLAREEDSMPVASTTGNRAAASTPSNAAVSKSNPSRCVLVKNAYKEEDETEPNWVKELEDDFKDECDSTYGPVVFCTLYRDSPDGEIYLKFKDVQGGDKAIKGLNGRMFGGLMLRAEPVVDAVFNTMFPSSAKH